MEALCIRLCFWKQRTVPENSKYSDAVQNAKETLIVEKVKGIRIKEVNSQFRNWFAKLRSFPGATWKHLKYYILPSIIDEPPDRIILHRGFNDVNNKTPTPEKITNGIADMGILFRDYGLNDIFISTLICSRGKFLNEKIKHVNFLLKLICEENWYIFIENKNTEIRDISIYHVYIIYTYVHMYIWYTSVRSRKD